MERSLASPTAILCLILHLVAVAAPAHAAAVIVLTPVSGPVGTAVTVSGSGFAPSASQTCEITSSPAGLFGSTGLTCTLSPDGGVSGSFRVADGAAMGLYYVRVTGPTGDSANATFGVTPILSVTCYLATQPVIIDGKWTTKSEWNDTPEFQLLQGSLAPGPGYLRIKHDSGALYLLADLPGDTQVEYNVAKKHGDYMQVFIDPLNNDGSKPQTDDLRYGGWYTSSNATNRMYPPHMELEAQHWSAVGKWGPNYWSGTQDLNARIGIDTGNSPHSPSPHVVTEFRIPLSVIKGTTFRLFMRYGDSSESEAMHWYWPGSFWVGEDAPDTWGSVNLSSVAVPEFSGVLLMVTVVILTVALIFRSKKLRHESPKTPRRNHN